MDEEQIPGLCNEVLDQFGEFMTMIEEQTRLSQMILKVALLSQFLSFLKIKSYSGIF